MKIRFDTPPARADQAGDLSVRYAAAKRTVPRWRWRLVLLLLALTPAYFVIRALSSFFWETAPGLVVMQSTVVRAGVSGHVTFLAESGARLARGDVLARVQPAKLVRGLAEVVEKLGVRIAEGTTVTDISNGVVTTARGWMSVRRLCNRPCAWPNNSGAWRRTG